MMNKKVALIPLLYNEYNYGGVLQFYALQRVIKTLGYEPNILKVDDEKRIFDLHRSLKSRLLLPIGNVVSFFRKKKIDRVIGGRYRRIDAFKQKFYCKTVDQSNINLQEYYAFICGSDQIWNPAYARKRNFLLFAPATSNKIIYAASLGVEKIDDWMKPKYIELTSNIDFISVREKTAKTILDEFLDRNDIQVVADPTLLLKPQEWLEIVSNRIISHNYIFVYILGELSTQQQQIITKYATNKELRIVRIAYASGGHVDNGKYGDHLVLDASPEEFLSLINYADAIFTDSFHACVFSILLKKQFFVFKRDNSNQMMGRIDTLLSYFSINNRVVKNDINEELIDYCNADHDQSLLLEKSIKFLKNALEGK